MQSIRVVDSGVIVVSAKNGIGVGTEKSWKYLYERKLPRFVYISKLDEEHADFFKTFEALREKVRQDPGPHRHSHYRGRQDCRYRGYHP